ncbi:MAG: hypothetical protein Q8R30_01405 [bacterium]|nr:hypothetical protein [bacterium]MDZ4285947.1 hypothetical protein [Candidatus Sungbacteria bacterium]
MTTHKKFFASKQAGAVAFTAGLILAVTGSVFASSIGSSLSVSGTSAITGLSTLTGAFVSQASSTVVGAFTVGGAGLGTFSGGYVSQASSTVVGNLVVTGPITSSSTAVTTGLISQASSTVDGTLTVSGAISASSSLVVLGNSLLTGSSTVNSTFVVTAGNLTTLKGGFISQASSTVVGNFSLGGLSRFSLGSSTPGSTMTINGSLMVASSTSLATTTITVDAPFTGSNDTTRGGCINLRATDGTMIRIYATSSPTAAQAYTNGNQGKGFEKLVVEAGSCQ